jgi:hypothetical protein
VYVSMYDIGLRVCIALYRISFAFAPFVNQHNIIHKHTQRRTGHVQ